MSQAYVAANDNIKYERDLINTQHYKIYFLNIQ